MPNHTYFNRLRNFLNVSKIFIISLKMLKLTVPSVNIRLNFIANSRHAVSWTWTPSKFVNIASNTGVRAWFAVATIRNSPTCRHSKTTCFIRIRFFGSLTYCQPAFSHSVDVRRWRFMNGHKSRFGGHFSFCGGILSTALRLKPGLIWWWYVPNFNFI